jgi:hypothetical protein
LKECPTRMGLHPLAHILAGEARRLDAAENCSRGHDLIRVYPLKLNENLFGARWTNAKE